MRHSHAHVHSVNHPSGATGYKTTITHTHPHDHGVEHKAHVNPPTHGNHKHDVKTDPRRQAQREWAAAANAHGLVKR